VDAGRLTVQPDGGYAVADVGWAGDVEAGLDR
jgi:hypothetical protein